MTVFHSSVLMLKSWLTGKGPDAGKDRRQEEKGMTEDKIVGWHHQLNGWVWVNSRRRWRTGMPDVLQSMGSQRVRHDRATKQQKMTALENSSENLQWRRITSCSRCKCKPPSVALRALWGPGRPLFSHLSSSAHPGARTVPCARHAVSSPKPRSTPFSRKYPSFLCFQTDSKVTC